MSMSIETKGEKYLDLGCFVLVMASRERTTVEHVRLSEPSKCTKRKRTNEQAKHTKNLDLKYEQID
jgi:hypothetical protein